MGGGEGSGPGGEEDVVFEVRGYDIGDGTGAVAEGREFGFYVGGESDGGEDGEGAGREGYCLLLVRLVLEGEKQTNCSAAAEFYTTEAEEWDGEGGDSWEEVADDHCFGGVGGDEFRGHFGGVCDCSCGR